ncbi:MAG: helix-turn-helix domain-containing protein [Nitrospirae bacterium]|nr:helix-turn-helix domain-containing protein [Nitrospirota bacterium]
MAELWDIKELSAYLGIKRSTLYAHIPEIPHYKINRLVRFRKEEIDAWLAGQHHDPTNIIAQAQSVVTACGRTPASLDHVIARSIGEVRRDYNGPIGKPGHAHRKEGR